MALVEELHDRTSEAEVEVEVHERAEVGKMTQREERADTEEEEQGVLDMPDRHDIPAVDTAEDGAARDGSH